MMKHLLAGILFGTLATIGLAAQTPIAMCPQSGALSVYMSMGAGGCSVGTLTFSNFSYSYTQTVNGTTTTTAPSSYNLSPYTGPNGTGLGVGAFLQTGVVQQETFTLTFDVSPNNGTAINGLGLFVGSIFDASASVGIQGSGGLGLSCRSSDIGQTCYPHLDGCSYCPASAQHENFPPIPSANVTVSEQASDDIPRLGGTLSSLAVTFDETPVVTPEPATWLLFGTGLLLMLGLVARARRNERIAG